MFVLCCSTVIMQCIARSYHVHKHYLSGHKWVRTALYTAWRREKWSIGYTLCMHIRKTTMPTSLKLKYQCMLPIAVACSFSGGIAMRYVLPVQWMTSYHGLHVSASPVLTATGLVNGRWRFSTPRRIHTPQPITKICHRWLFRRPNFGGVNRRLQAKRPKYWKFYIIETTVSIPAKFCITIETTKYSHCGWFQHAEGRHFEHNR